MFEASCRNRNANSRKLAGSLKEARRKHKALEGDFKLTSDNSVARLKGEPKEIHVKLEGS